MTTFNPGGNSITLAPAGASPEVPGYKTTKNFSYPLPPALAPHRALPWKDGRVNVSDPTNNSPTKKARMVMDTSVTRLLSDTAGLVSYAYRDAVNTLAHDPGLIHPVLNALATQNDNEVTTAVNHVVDRINRSGFGTSSREWATALFEWMDYIDYGGTELVPEPFAPFVEAYYNAIRRRGWTFDPEMSNRFVTRAGERGVLPNVPVICSTNRVYRDRNGGLVSLRATTSKNPQGRVPEYAGAAGLASVGTQMLGKGARSVWHDLSEESGWGSARFGMLHIDRTLVPGRSPEVTLHGFDIGIALDLAKSALASFEVQHSPMAARASSTAEFITDLIMGRISEATSVADMSDLYKEYQDVWTDDLTALANHHIEGLGIAPTSTDAKEQ